MEEVEFLTVGYFDQADGKLKTECFTGRNCVRKMWKAAAGPAGRVNHPGRSARIMRMSALERRVKDRTAALEKEINERKQTEEQLKKTTQQFRQLAENVHDLVVLDLGLPRKEGLDVLRSMRRRGDARPARSTGRSPPRIMNCSARRRMRIKRRLIRILVSRRPHWR